MVAWFSLLKKEWHQSRTAMAVIALILLFLGFAGVVVTYNNPLPGEAPLPLLFAIWAIFWHVLFMPIFITVSINSELKNTAHLWLHLPQSGWSLLLAKWVMCILGFAMSFGLTSLFTLWYASVDMAKLGLTWPLVWKFGILTAAMVTTINLFLSIWAMLATVVDNILRARLGKMAGILTLVLLLILPYWSFSRFTRTQLYDTLFRWGKWDFLSAIVETENISFVISASPYTGEVLLFLCLGLGMFVLTGWLLDRKVEI